MAQKIFVDFNNADGQGRIRLNTNGTLDDLGIKKIELVDGLEILLDNHESLITSGIIHFSTKEKIWVAAIDSEKLNH